MTAKMAQLNNTSWSTPHSWNVEIDTDITRENSTIWYMNNFELMHYFCKNKE